MQAGAHDHRAGEVGARAANLHMPERPMIIAKLEQRLDDSGMATCEHMQQTG